MKLWETFAFGNEAERHRYYRDFPLPKGHSVATFWQDPVFKKVLFERACVQPGSVLKLYVAPISFFIFSKIFW